MVHTGEDQGEVDVVPDGEGVQQVKVLKHESQVFPAEVCQVSLRDGSQVLPVQQHLAAGGGWSREATMFSSVVLPEPDSP